MVIIPNDSTVRRLNPLFDKAADVLKKSLEEGRPVMIRFNNDSDGISAGLLVQNALQHFVKEKHLKQHVKLVRSGQANGAHYTMRLAEEDALISREVGRITTIVCLDFGGNEDSIAGLKAAKESGLKVIILDHHPTDNKLVSSACELFITPHEFAEKQQASQYTAGLLAYFLLKRFKKPDALDEKLVKTSLYADVSDFAFGGKRPAEEEMLHAMMSKQVPEWLALYRQVQGTREGTTLDQYSKTIADAGKVARLHENAVIGLKRAIERANHIEKKIVLENGIEINEVSMPKVITPGKWPSRSIFTTAWALSKGSKRPVITLVTKEEHCAFRVNAKAREMGFDASQIILQLKKEFGKDLTSGGGHAAASAMTYHTSREKEILERIQEIAAELPTASTPARA